MVPEIVTYADRHFEGAKRLWQAAFPNPTPWNAPEIVIPAKIAGQPDLFLVALYGDDVIGSAMAGYDGHRGWLYLVAVLPSFRRRGIGTALVREAERRLVALGCVKINLQVQMVNKAVCDFYEQLGFVVEERVSMGKCVGAFAD